jgi:cysteinyl-tRNA synthetase
MTDPQPKLQLFNTLTGKLEDFNPLEPGKVKMYVCGPTVYDDAHLGHARCYITWDVLYRFLKFLGYDVTYVRNVTDVDDKILNRAKERGELPKDVAERNYDSFKADMAALNVLSPDREPKATEYIGTMIEVIEGLIAKNAAYVAPDGTVYFRVSADGNYGQLSKKPLDELKSGARVDVDPNKENPLDFALWKSVPPEEQTDEKLSQGYCFASPWGRGRPGWHIECSAMNYAILGPQIDIHAGGADLVFPHHENEIAQTETWQNLAGGPDDACANHRFAKYWLHNGFVNVSGEKMSKSLGNFSTIKKLMGRDESELSDFPIYDANTIRRFLLNNGYRMPVDFNNDSLKSAQQGIRRVIKRIQKMCENLNISEQDLNTFDLDYQQYVLEKTKHLDTNLRVFLIPLVLAIESLESDLETPNAISQLHQLSGYLEEENRLFSTRNANQENYRGSDFTHKEFCEKILQYTITLFNLLGFSISPLSQSISASGHLSASFSMRVTAQVIPTSAIRTIYKELSGNWLEEDKAAEVLLAEIVEYRKKAKEIKNWTQADAIRKHLTDIGLQILDNKDGTTTVEKDGLEIVRV